jgi:polar amino acid transport system substrate-binding protein
MRVAMKALACAATLLWWLPAHALPQLKIVVDASTAMPMALIADSQVVGGIHRDLGIAIARELNTEAAFVLMPRKRIPGVLERGAGHLSCHYLPEWMPGQLDWTEPFMPNSLLLLSSARVARPPTLLALRGVRIGTVHGFEYPDMTRILGVGFMREDAADLTHNLLKLDAGRIDHALAGEVFLRYQQRRHGLAVKVRNPLVVRRYVASCAVSRASPYPVEQINRAIKNLRERREIDAIYDKYR